MRSRSSASPDKIAGTRMANLHEPAFIQFHGLSRSIEESHISRHRSNTHSVHSFLDRCPDLGGMGVPVTRGTIHRYCFSKGLELG